MKLADDQWTIEHLHEHLQFAVNLELWTIPFYLSPMLSIVDRTTTAFQLIQSIVNQEMLHLEMAANISNAYGFSPTFDAPVYAGQGVPHLNFAIDDPDPRPRFSPYSAEIGPLDAERINAMCLVEFPEWDQSDQPDLHDDVTEYGSIGAFYDAVAHGASLLKRLLRGGVNQVDHLSAFYDKLPSLTVSDDGQAGWRQAALLIDVIQDQGEGSRGNTPLPPAYQNTGDDASPALAHFQKFMNIRSAGLPATYPVKAPGDETDDDRDLRTHLVDSFTRLRADMTTMFAGRGTGTFLPDMITVGAAIQTCWQRGLVPRFS